MIFLRGIWRIHRAHMWREFCLVCLWAWRMNYAEKQAEKNQYRTLFHWGSGEIDRELRERLGIDPKKAS